MKTLREILRGMVNLGCWSCDHPYEYHTEKGCVATYSEEDRDDEVSEIRCDCERFR